jgi:hypothetical protein
VLKNQDGQVLIQHLVVLASIAQEKKAKTRKSTRLIKNAWNIFLFRTLPVGIPWTAFSGQRSGFTPWREQGLERNLRKQTTPL